MWFEQLSGQLSGKKNTYKSAMKLPWQDAIIMLFSVGLQGDINTNENLKVFKKKEALYGHVKNLFLNTPVNNKQRYIYLLQSLNQIAKVSRKAAGTFMERIYPEIKKEIVETYNRFKKKQILDVSQESEKDVQMNSRIFAAQVYFIGSLLNAKDEKRKNIIEPEDNSLWQILNIINHQQNDPLILTSVCYLLRQLLKIKEIVYDPKTLKILLNQIQDVAFLIDYLGQSKINENKFEQLLKDVQKYSIKKKNYQQEFETAKALVNIDDPIIINLFVAIIRLLNMFGFWKRHFIVNIKDLK